MQVVFKDIVGALDGTTKDCVFVIIKINKDFWTQIVSKVVLFPHERKWNWKL